MDRWLLSPQAGELVRWGALGWEDGEKREEREEREERQGSTCEGEWGRREDGEEIEDRVK